MRRECLGHILVLGESYLYRLIWGYVAYFNHARSQQGIEQQIPEALLSIPVQPEKAKIVGLPVLNGLDHDCWVAA
jgi:hypothetical protein